AWWCPGRATPRRLPPRRSGGGFEALESFVADLRKQDPLRPVELWCQDEARLGLKPVARRVWALKGTRPTRSGRQRFQSLYVYGFARWADPASEKRLVLLVDNAGAHLAKKLVVPANVRLFRLPSCTPELQPAEHLWPLVREGMANRDFDHLVALGGKLR